MVAISNFVTYSQFSIEVYLSTIELNCFTQFDFCFRLEKKTFPPVTLNFHTWSWLWSWPS